MSVSSSVSGMRCSVCEKPSGMRCSRCKITQYCGVECQKSDWLTHKYCCCLSKEDFLKGVARIVEIQWGDSLEGVQKGLTPEAVALNLYNRMHTRGLLTMVNIHNPQISFSNLGCSDQFDKITKILSVIEAKNPIAWWHSEIKDHPYYNISKISAETIEAFKTGEQKMVADCVAFSKFLGCLAKENKIESKPVCAGFCPPFTQEITYSILLLLVPLHQITGGFSAHGRAFRTKDGIIIIGLDRKEEWKEDGTSEITAVVNAMTPEEFCISAYKSLVSGLENLVAERAKAIQRGYCTPTKLLNARIALELARVLGSENFRLFEVKDKTVDERD
jgi:hypothetical protein